MFPCRPLQYNRLTNLLSHTCLLLFTVLFCINDLPETLPSDADNNSLDYRQHHQPMARTYKANKKRFHPSRSGTVGNSDQAACNTFIIHVGFLVVGLALSWLLWLVSRLWLCTLNCREVACWNLILAKQPFSMCLQSSGHAREG